MLQKVLIKDNTNLPLSYAKELDAFRDGTEYNFKPGVNIILGPNGCGKSTLFKLLQTFFWCKERQESTFIDGLNLNDRDSLFNDKDESVKDGIIINHDYITKVFCTKPYSEMTGDTWMSGIDNFKLSFSSMHSSVGEGTLNMLSSIFGLMFKEGQDYNFILEKLKGSIKSSNEIWGKRFKNLYEYYKKNHVCLSESEITVLMDEPDRNLDILNINEVYGILSYHKPQTQIIASLHNPLLIYKLSKLDEINFIELEEGYLWKLRRTIKDFIK